VRDEQIQEMHHKQTTRIQENERKDKLLEQTRQQLEASEQLVAEFQQSLQQKDDVIFDLQRTVSAQQRMLEEIQGLVSRQQPENMTMSPAVTMTNATIASAPKDISNMRWRESRNAPEDMCRGEVVVVDGNTAYFVSGLSHSVYSYQTVLGEWTQLPDNPNQGCGLAIIDGLLTTVGGTNTASADTSLVSLSGEGISTNTLLSLCGESGGKEWSEVFPPMPTPRSFVACITTKQALVVAGGCNRGEVPVRYVNKVELMDKDSGLQFLLYSKRFQHLRVGDTLYLAGGYTAGLTASKSVFSCTLADLLSSTAPGPITQQTDQSVWKERLGLPLRHSMDTCCQLVEEMNWTLPPMSIDTISTLTLGYWLVR
jgi:hypothetical protein